MTSLDIIQALRARRLRFHIRQRTVAQELGVRPTQMAKWEKGRAEPKFSAICRWARVLGMTVDLLEGR